jgi:hypothetical protein
MSKRIMTTDEMHAFADKVADAFLEGLKKAVPLPVEDLVIRISEVVLEQKHLKFNVK